MSWETIWWLKFCTSILAIPVVVIITVHTEPASLQPDFTFGHGLSTGDVVVGGSSKVDDKLWIEDVGANWPVELPVRDQGASYAFRRGDVLYWVTHGAVIAHIVLESELRQQQLTYEVNHRATSKFGWWGAVAMFGFIFVGVAVTARIIVGFLLSPSDEYVRTFLNLSFLCWAIVATVVTFLVLNW
jgi:ribosomal protein S16